MTPVADDAYPTAVLTLYVGLPDTPRRSTRYDEAVARSLFERRVPLEIVEAGMLLASLRRYVRPPGALPLPGIRSLAYFSPIIDELQSQPMSTGYLEHLRHKSSQVFSTTVISNHSQR